MNEKEFEDIICKYPELIENGLLFKGRQATVQGKRVDVLFEDRHGQTLILEIKKGTVKREHTSQPIDYAGYFVSLDGRNVRVMLVGNRVPEPVKRSMDYIGIEWKKLPIKTMIQFLSEKGDSALIPCLLSEEPITSGSNVSEHLISSRHGVTKSPVKASRVPSSSADPRYIRFWDQLEKLALQRAPSLRIKKNRSQHQYYRDIDIGYPGAHICLTLHTRIPEVTCELQIPNSQELYDWLHIRKTELIRLLNCQPLWIAIPGKYMRKIRTLREANIFELEDTDWESHLVWLLQTAERFQQVFLDILHQRE